MFEIKQSGGGLEQTEGIKKALEKFLPIIGRNVHLMNPHRERYIPYSDLSENEFTILFYAMPKKLDTTDIKSAYGISLTGGQCAAHKGICTLQPISDGSEMLGEVGPNGLYIYFDLPHRAENQERVMTCIMEDVIKYLEEFKTNGFKQFVPKIERNDEPNSNWRVLLDSMERILIINGREHGTQLHAQYVCGDVSNPITQYEDQKTYIYFVCGHPNGFPLISSEDNGVGFWVDNRIVVLSCRDLQNWRQIESFGNFLKLVLKCPKDQNINIWISEQERMKTIEQMKQLALKRFAGQIDQTKNRLSEVKSEIGVYRDSLISRIREQASLSLELETLQKMECEQFEDVQEEIENLFKIPQLVSARISEDNKFIVETHNIYIDSGNQRYDIGKFRITIFLGKNSGKNVVIFQNLTRIVETNVYSKAHHPHINGDGYACLGNMLQPLVDAVARYDFTIATLICIRFLESVNLEDKAGRTITYWSSSPIVSEEVIVS